MIETYLAALLVCAASVVIGQAVVALCGARRWSWLAPAAGLAVLSIACWAAVRLPGEGATAAIAAALVTLGALLVLHGRVEGAGRSLRIGLPVALGALAAGSLPFLVEGHFGILGTGFNPDMSQHLLTTDRLAEGAGSELSSQGYPLGPHAIVAALNGGLGIGLVDGFSGLTLAVAVLAPLTALTILAERPAAARTAAALVIGLPYLVASYYAQGAFKETMQALYVLGFVLALWAAGREGKGWEEKEPSARSGDSLLGLVPAAVIAAGSIYAYSFAGLVWPIGIAAVAAAGALAHRRGVAWRPAAVALGVLALLALPELGRMIDFQRFETFDPTGPGLGNLFGQISPLTALGIWPSGDFRVAAGDGTAPTIAHYLGAAFAFAMLALGLALLVRRRRWLIPGAVLVAALVYLLARVDGTPYQAAKALEVAAPLLALAILAPGTARSPSVAERGKGTTAGGLIAIAAWAYLLAAGLCSLLAFANAPVGPTSYSPELTGLRPTVASASTLVLAPEELLADQHGERYIVWELRGGRVCVEPESAAGGPAPRGIGFVVTTAAFDRAPCRGFELRRRAGPHLLWERAAPFRGDSGCPLIAVRQARRGT